MNVTEMNHVQAILTIFKVDSNDHGSYSCEAVNKKGSIREVIPVNVESKYRQDIDL